MCRFCKKRFYDGDELYRHMESSHEHCFICRKQHPNRFVYYKDYAELDGERGTEGVWGGFAGVQGCVWGGRGETGFYVCVGGGGC